MNKRRRIVAAGRVMMGLWLATSAAPPSAAGKTALDTSEFGSLTVLENGRKMPMDSFARMTLLQFAGKSTLQREPAIDWLCRVFFTPEATVDDKVILINHPQVVQSLHLQTEPRRRYSLSQIRPRLAGLQQAAQAAAAMDKDARTLVEDELLRVAHNVNTYMALREAFAFTMAGSDHARVRHRPPPMIPVAFHGEEQWVSPSDLLSLAVDRPEEAERVAQLGAVAAAYREGNQVAFDDGLKAFRDAVNARAIPDRQLRHIAQEFRFNRLNLLYRCELLYGVAFLFGFAVLAGRGRWTRWVGCLCLLAGLLMHTTAIGMRMDIMGRPPVTNLYSTFIFVAWSSVLLCAIMERVQKHGLGLLCGGLSGLALLLLSRRFMSMSDPMGVLVAVLDSNFWLATHVVTISLGYAGCVLAGVIAHVYLVQAIVRPSNRERLRSLYVALFAVLGFGFTFSFLGTMLGGVWADQSWGRFWGWDPKENGALLIVLWCAILFHARLSRMIGNVGMAAGCIVGTIVVMFAWVGVNLLGVGLHAYGFTRGVAGGLFGYTAIQMVVVVALAWAAARRLRGAETDAGAGKGCAHA